VPFQAEDAYELTSSSTLATPPDQLDLELQRLAAAYRPDHWAGNLRINAENGHPPRGDPVSLLVHGGL